MWPVQGSGLNVPEASVSLFYLRFGFGVNRGTVLFLKIWSGGGFGVVILWSSASVQEQGCWAIGLRRLRVLSLGLFTFQGWG